MRVAFSGAHRTGKTTLIESVSGLVSGYEVLDEPYRLLDLIVLVPIEHPDRISVGVHEDRRLRSLVDELLHGLVLDDSLGLGVEAMEIFGPPDDRIRTVMRALRSG
ncbi:MAG: hypothetical protein AB7P03_07245 [Kofleriaceae bacterium]